MSRDTEKHHALLGDLQAAMGKADGSFEQAVTNAFAHVFAHLERLATVGGAGNEDRPLQADESPTLR